MPSQTRCPKRNSSRDDRLPSLRHIDGNDKIRPRRLDPCRYLALRRCHYNLLISSQHTVVCAIVTGLSYHSFHLHVRYSPATSPLCGCALPCPGRTTSSFVYIFCKVTQLWIAVAVTFWGQYSLCKRHKKLEEALCSYRCAYTPWKRDYIDVEVR